jgi:hypothetical protein
MILPGKFLLLKDKRCLDNGVLFWFLIIEIVAIELV